MNKYVKYALIGIAVIGILAAVVYFLKKNSTPLKTYETETVEKRDITNKVVVTGKVIPQDEIEIKPQISGIIQKVYLEEGVQVKAGDLIATIKVVPNEQSLNQARGRVNNAKIALNNTKIEYDRNKSLFDKGVISSQDFNALQLQYDQATQELQNAQADYQIIRVGSAGGSSSANTNIRATVTGTLLEIPVEEGDQVIESNNFNDGTTIAFIADMSKMIFEGEVDEAEVGKLKVGMPLEISMGALQDEKFNAKLKFIAPKGVEEEGAVQFRIEGDLAVSDSTNIRAGYSANAAIVLEEKKDVLSIKEALLQFDKETNKPYVEIEIGENEFEKRELELGVSDGIDVEIISGIDENSKIKIWNKLEAKSNGDAPNED
ncbi:MULTISPECIES: efflux RND transporter periplasmic adaptor subunit [Maribacter]|uniref:HlyD family secretion protein n=1 Tax=Maribacter dokdonensis TaxID=320912 RepID=A0A1H4MZ37_9FLAO|nr:MULTISPECIES: efflux RND transporter periplasmic adaptor subunit [Maribacter]HAF76996.1 efflux RND transporter periplasmic adaptor subunit [Maribacter sp.]APA64841.1 RND transporter MFP subunit [Maribacter sp. 1_2014MBL_MicDiv]MDP2525593.1 efflux RND transporter periplasmic adaptor subunit [Maribacter dokdonensis]PHN94400.1 efflux RND transporter periplasmic adaptor subunit [Maribacter sp. 6B07]CAG2534855.1 HlyD family secretion protein [Maribacter dokdonensis]|tara:strand:+ start:121022 stop:122146 length:1125 start_codon:yes stop_codon:yes gene_type:complete